jgi:cytochrome c553
MAMLSTPGARATRWVMRRLMRLLMPLAAGLLQALPAQAQAQAPGVPDTLAQRALACTTCHGSSDRVLPDAYIPRIAGKPAGYLFEQMRNFRSGRRVHAGMTHLFEPLEERYLLELAQHFAAQKPSPPAAARQALAPAAAQRAQAWVQRGDPAAQVPACAACHGSALTGVAPAVPGLLGLPAAYVSAQLGAWRQGLRHAREPDCMAQVARALPLEDIAAIARWLEAQPLPTAAEAAPAASAPGRWPLVCGSVRP